MPSTWKLSAIVLAAFLGAASAQTLDLVAADFDASAYNKLLACVKETGTTYDVAVDEGRTIIIPIEGKQIDIDESDKALGVCLDQFAPLVKLGIDDERDLVAEKPITSLEQATAEWAQANGAQGVTSVAAQNATLDAPVEERSASSGSLLAARVAPKSYYYAHGSYYDHCHSAGSIITYTNTCKSQMGAYKSIAFGNADAHHSLRVSMWPHHDCANRHNDQGRRTISVPAGHTSGCQEKTTYSWYGRYCC